MPSTTPLASTACLRRELGGVVFPARVGRAADRELETVCALRPAVSLCFGRRERFLKDWRILFPEVRWAGVICNVHR